jgi:hypothetical protein
MIVKMFKAIDWYMDNPLELIESPGNIAELLEKRGVAASIFIDGYCIGCGGYLLWEDDLAEAWIRIDEKGLEHKMAALRAMRFLWDKVTNGPSSKGVRIFCWVDPEWNEAQRMIEWLGFTEGEESRELNGKEYKVWYYGNGNDDFGNGSISCGADSAGQDDATASRGPSRD